MIPTLIIGGGALIAFFVWTLPNGAVFTQNVAHFNALWQIAANRRIILILVIKVSSPLLVGSLLAACTWLWYLFFQEAMPAVQETARVSHALQRQQQAAGPTNPGSWVSTVPSVPGPTLVSSQEAQVPMASEQPEQFMQINLETPQPPMLDHLQPLQQYRGNERQQRKAESGQAPPAPSPQIIAPRASGNDREQKSSEKQDASVQPVTLPRLGEQRPYEVSITLLKKVSMTLITAQGISREVPLSLNAKRVQLLAYLAWQRGQQVNRDRMLEQVFGHGKDDEEATREKLGEAFDSHKKLIRWDLRDAINKLNRDAGNELIPVDLDIFAHKQRLYWLSEVCHVSDLEEIETQHEIIERARKEGLLVDQVPDDVKTACDQLIAAYTGDFLEELVTGYVDDFEPWTSSWARKPYTLFRDYYLQALWYAAEYELRQGQVFSVEHLNRENETNRKEQRKHWGLAAQLYRTYAMTACSSRFDTKVTFGSGGREHGERVIMSERALRRSLVLYGSMEATHQVDQVYSAYYKHMRSISAKAWEPSKATLTDLSSAKEQTSAYRFPKQAFLLEPLPSREGNLEIASS